MKSNKDISVNKTEDFQTESFKLSTVLNHCGPLYKKATPDAGDLATLINGAFFGGDLEVIDCDDLQQFKQLLEQAGKGEAYILGSFQQDGELFQSAELAWSEGQLANVRDPSKPLSTNDLFQFRINETALMLFDLKFGRNDTLETVLGKLYAIDPRLRHTGLLIVYSPISNILDTSSGLMITGVENIHIYCLVKNGADIPRYGEIFAKRSWLQEPGHTELSESGMYLERQFVNVAAFHPEHMVCESSLTLDDGLTQERPPTELQPGGILDTEMLKDLSQSEGSAYERLVNKARAACSEVYEQGKEQWREIKTREIMEFTGCSFKEASRATWLVSEADLLADVYTLEFEEFGWVTVADVLSDPTKFDGELLSDPIPYNYFSDEATFEWRDGNPKVSSSAYGGCIYVFSPIQVDPSILPNVIGLVGSDDGVLWKPEITNPLIDLLYGDWDQPRGL